MLGADVIKVEHPDDPDQSRDGGTDRALNRQHMGTSFLTQGSNKRSITLNLKTEPGREILKRLVATADVLVENFRPGAFEALGLGYAAMSAINPRLIYCSISAFGQDGPRREQTAYDHVIQATSGLMAMTGTEEVNPIKFGAPAVDYATGTMGAFALASALFQRERTGKGQHIDLAMVGVAMMLMGSHLTGYMRTGAEPRPHRQQAALRHQQLLRGQGWTCDDRRQQSGATAPPVAGAGAARHDQGRQRGARGRPRPRGGGARRHTRRGPRTSGKSTFRPGMSRRRGCGRWPKRLQTHISKPEACFTTTPRLPGVDGPFGVPLAAFKFAHGGPSIETPPPNSALTPTRCWPSTATMRGRSPRSAAPASSDTAAAERAY